MDGAAHRKRMVGIVAVVGLFIAWSVVLYFNSPESIATWIGVENSYVLLLFLALLGGTSILFPFPYYLFTLSFGAAGLNPFFLGLSAGVGTLVGDSTSYYLGYRGSDIAPPRALMHFKKVHDWAEKRHPALLPFLAFIYAISPFPDDLLMVPAGLVKYPLWRLIIGVGPGKIIFNTLVALSGYYGWQLFVLP